MEIKKIIVAGIDAGSTTVKVTLYDGTTMESWLGLAGWNPQAEATALLGKGVGSWQTSIENLAYIIGTGYGRVNLPFVTKSMTEITCHGKGAAFLHPGVCTVIDVGGQDAKAIRVLPSGKVSDFIMNDKCAAGTGRFMQVMAHALGIDVSNMEQTALLPGEEACTINSMCTVFAESEVIGLLNQGRSRQAIMAGIYQSIASRIGTMAATVGLESPLVFTGGVSQNITLCEKLENVLKMPVIVPEQAVFAGSIGAALYAWDEVKK
jgi:predicted CoA-substrate-specific enzyme activase